MPVSYGNTFETFELQKYAKKIGVDEVAAFKYLGAPFTATGQAVQKIELQVSTSK